MNQTTQSLYWQLLENAEAVAHEACQRILAAAEQAITERNDSFRIVLAGGRTPELAYRQLRAANTDWERWHIYYGDERCLPENDAQRNSVMASQALLAQVPIPLEQIHVIPAQLGPAEAARYYTEEVKQALPFDMVLLGMGEDGHTASLFPGHVHPQEELVHAVYHSPKPPPERVSLSVKALCHTRELLILVTGASKRDAVTRWQRGENLPIAQIQPPVGATVLIDRAALV